MDRLGGTSSESVVFATARTLTAVDLATGQPRWSTRIDLPEAKDPVTLARYRDDWICARRNTVVVVDGLSGAIKSRFQVAFTIRAALVQEGCLVLAGDAGTACIDDDGMRWSSRTDWTTAEFLGPRGEVQSRIPHFTGEGIRIGIGSVVSDTER